MESTRRQGLNLLMSLVLVLVVGTVGFMFFEDGWSVLDALYMTVITITTIGFGEVHHLSTGGRIFTMVLVFFGLGVAAVFATQIAKAVVASSFRNRYGERKMRDKVNKLRGHYIVCGYGRIGAAIGLKLHETGLDFVIVDEDEEALDRARQRGYLVVRGDAASDGILLTAGIDRALGVVLCINDDSANINISLAARELNPNAYIVARGKDPAIEYRMIRAGANTVVYPLTLGGEQIARLLVRQSGNEVERRARPGGDVLGYGLRLYRHFGDEPQSVADALAAAGGLDAVAVRRKSGEREGKPAPDALLDKGDALVVLINEEEREDTGQDILITWSDELLVGLPAIDAEHRILVKYAEDFQQAVLEGRAQEAVVHVFDKLLDYTASHFAREEALMRKHDYPELDGHIAEHRRITGEVMELNREKRYVFSRNVGIFLNDWIIHHILERDKAFARYMDEKHPKGG